MLEIVFNADSYETVLEEATRLGFTYTDENDNKHIAVSGPVAGGGAYFLNYVGTVYQPTGNMVKGEDGVIVATGNWLTEQSLMQLPNTS